MLRAALTFIACLLMLAGTVWFMVKAPALLKRHDFSRDATVAAPAFRATFRDVAWSELVPADWNPASRLRELQQGAQSMADNDPRALTRLQKIRDLWARAPADAHLAGAAVRLPGYVVPLETREGGVTEFLLVPYFGACIHTPPPPANQIVRVVARQAVQGLHAMDAVRVSGVLQIEHSDTGLGSSSYAMQVEHVEPYRP
jgi:hypothetical protein